MDNKLKQKALNQLAHMQGLLAENVIAKEADNIKQILLIESQYELIELQIAFLDTISFRVHEKAIKIFIALLERLKSIHLTYGNLAGYPQERLKLYQNSDKLVIQVLESIRHIRYHAPDEILKIFLEYSLHKNEDVCKQAISGIESMARYDLDIFYGDGKEWKGLGWMPQEKILKKIKILKKDKKKQYLTAIFAAIKQILSPSIEGATSTYNTVTLKTASIPAAEGLIKLRKDALEILKLLYYDLDNIKDKKQLLTVMQTATQFSRSSERTKEVEQIIVENTVFVLQVMNEIIESEDLQIMQTIEHEAYWYYYHMGAISSEIEKTALKINDKLTAHEEYQIFRVLIGFESIFHDWKEERSKDFYEDERKLREQKAFELVQKINEKNYDEWKNRIINYAAIQSNDMATFPYFVKFLDDFGKELPILAIRLLSEVHEEFENFVAPILLGIDRSNKKKELSDLLNSWIVHNTNLLAVARFLEFTQNFKKLILTKLFHKAKSLENIPVLSQVITVVFAQYKKGRETLIKDILIPDIKLCTKKQYANWIFNLWFKKEYIDVLNEINERDYYTILENLMWLNKIGYEAEEVIFPIARRFPIMVIKFFCDRICKGLETTNDKFEEVPFQFSSLSAPLSKGPDQAVDLILSYKKSDNRLFIYNAARLLNLIFPKLEEHPAFEKKLIQHVRAGNDDSLFFIADILRGYEGEQSIYEICKELIKIANNNEELLNAVYIALQSTSVVNGEDGLVLAYQEKIQAIEPWLNDNNVDVVIFAQNYKESLERQVNIEKQRTEEDIVLRKHQYGLDDE